jgi:hypothetical protein
MYKQTMFGTSSEIQQTFSGPSVHNRQLSSSLAPANVTESQVLTSTFQTPITVS